ncbi:transketolase, partial [Streptomyces sp. DconLS]
MTITTDEHRAHEYADLPRLMSLMTGDEKHGPAATSTLDVLWVLYDRVLRVTRSGRRTPAGPVPAEQGARAD